MSEFFDHPPRRPRPTPQRSRGPSPLVLTGMVLAVLFVLGSLFTGIYTDKLWYDSVGFGSVFTTRLMTRIGLFLSFGVVMALVVGLNLAIAFRLRPVMHPRTPDQAALERYRQVITPMSRLLLIGSSALLGIFAGISASGHWETFLLWRNQQPFGTTDPYFGKDVGFYVFSLPWLHFLVDFGFTVLVVGILAALLVHYLYAGIRLAGGATFTGGAQVQLSVLLGLLLLLKAVDYWLDRFDLNVDIGSRFTGMSYTREHAVLPSKNILLFIAIICALLLFANVVRRTWTLPAVGIALLALSAILLGMIWPAIVQNFTVDPSEADKEAPYINKNIDATRTAYDVADAKVVQYDAQQKVGRQGLRADAASLPGIRLVDPQEVSATFEQLQQVRGYYTMPSVLDVDRYQIDGRERDLVVAAREVRLSGLPPAAQNWNNIHTVYTHGYGMVAAYGNQRNAEDQPVVNDEGKPVWAESNLPPTGELSRLTKGGYRPQIYYGEQSPDYSVVGKAPGGKSLELDFPRQGGSTGSATNNTYEGTTGVDIGSTFRKLLYAVKFSDANIFLSSRVHENSRLLYDRSPFERVQKVAPWLEIDRDALPTVVNGKIVWLLDGYTHSDEYPLSEKRSLAEMTSDSLTPQNPFGALPTDNINYMRNSVKAVVDAYDGSVKLYAWDTKDPMLKAWRHVFPGTVLPKSAISPALKAHMRYPEDLYKVQRNILADYHVMNPKAFYGATDRWEVPQDPNNAAAVQPPYRLSVATDSGQRPTFSLTSTYVPTNRQNLAAFMAIGADASKPSSYGKFTILRLPDNKQVPGPSQMANLLESDRQVTDQLLRYTRGAARAVRGNLLTLPVGGGLLYVQPLYTERTSGTGTYPQLRYVVVSFGQDVGIGTTLAHALDDALGITGSTGAAPTTGGGGPVSTSAMRLLQQADAAFNEAQRALRKGDPVGYAKKIEEARKLVSQALVDAGKTPAKKPQSQGSSPSASSSASPSPSKSQTPTDTPGQGQP